MIFRYSSLILFFLIFLIWNANAISQNSKQTPQPNGSLETMSLPKAQHAEVDFTVRCQECHREVTPEIVAAWEDSLHGKTNVGCFVCHGDGSERFYAKPQDEVCLSCHAKKQHGNPQKNLSCFSCHNGHTLHFHN